MARSKGNIIIKGLFDTIENQLVVKQYGEKAVVTKYPDMSRIIASEEQKIKRNFLKKRLLMHKTF